MIGATCERCERMRSVMLPCQDSKGPWLLCSMCWIDIVTDNAELRARAPRRGGERG